MRPIPFYNAEEMQGDSWPPAHGPFAPVEPLPVRRPLAKRFYWAFRANPRNALADANDTATAWRARATRRMVDLSGVKVKLGSHCSLRLTREILVGTYELPERQLLCEALEPTDIVMEMGTAIGVVATQCAKAIGSDRVVSFEANPDMVAAANETFALNGVTPRLVHGALGKTSGPREFFVEADFWSSSTLQRSDDARCISVPGISLEAALVKYRPTFLIVDIEGGEVEIIDELLAYGARKLLIEFHPSVTGPGEVQHAKQAIVAAGYTAQKELSEGNQMYYVRRP